MSHVMQVLERLVLGWLSLHDLESLKFAYHPLVGVNDAVIYLLQNTHSHLNSEKMSEKKLRMDFTTSNVSWIAVYMRSTSLKGYKNKLKESE